MKNVHDKTYNNRINHFTSHLQVQRFNLPGITWIRFPSPCVLKLLILLADIIIFDITC